jgi:hydrogenase maturation protease
MSFSVPPMTTLVLGLGNLVHGDDGVGIHAVERLQKDRRVPASVVLMDGGTQGLNLIPHISGFQRLLVIDAVDAGKEPGTLIRLEGNALQTLPGKPSVHQLGFADLMIAMKLLGEPPEEVVVIGVQPQSTEWSAELTAPVHDSLDELLTVVLTQLESWTALPDLK